MLNRFFNLKKMGYLKIISVAFVALIHFYIFYIEMFKWTSKRTRKSFGIATKEFAEETKVMAANQGLYNLFLAAGLVWSLVYNKEQTILFFLGCVFVVGIYGAYSTKQIRILYIQTLTASVAILLNLLF